jgi:hypothetical protein
VIGATSRFRQAIKLLADREAAPSIPDGVIRFFHVHMHLRGKSYAFRFTYPDGRVRDPVRGSRTTISTGSAAAF